MGRKAFAVAAMLAVRLGEHVPVDELADVVWAGNPPAKFRESLYTYVSSLRRALRRPESITRSGAGYRLELDRAEVDLHAFDDLAEHGRRLAAAGDYRAAAAKFTAALTLWRGDALAGLPGSWVAARRQEFADQRLVVMADRVDAELAAGDAEPVVSAPHRYGRRDVSLGQLPRPRQLPADVADFTGRADQLTQLSALLGRSDEGMPLGLITGRPGVGKSCLAVRAAHRASSQFPGGQLFARLGNADPADVLAAFLRALGLSVPSEVDERARLYRSVLADRPALVVLDDAVSEHQVRPLLPGGPGSAVLVTSRRSLTGLHDAKRLPLNPFGLNLGIELLAEIAGSDRVRAEADSAHEIVRLCGGVPLAVRIAGARLVTRPLLRLASLADRLRAPESVLTELVAGDLAVTEGLHWAYDQLAPPDRPALARLAAIGETALTPVKIAALLGLRRFEAEDLLDRLVGAHLVDAAEPGGHISHLVRAFLAGQRDEHAVSA
ncbi:BTAD domain-containing putative transcriptional regulator [Kutzneria chonburiensis]|uniref:BTAD domain-containing putative transcriptional regulator n=1 Tax=Kutzneria chonburiensis TaxID=1483604 RepID=UPI0023612AF4|nr:BTAD domain-containing putative transcriptional regulator [Kutzneria chonburiensis]